MENPKSKREIKNQMIDFIENSDLSIRSRIDLKKEIKNDNIRDMETLNNRINEISENKTSTTIKEPIVEDIDKLKSIVLLSKLKESYKNYYIKKIDEGIITEIKTLNKEIESDERKLYLISSLEKYNLKDYSKTIIKKQIRNNTITDFKALREEIKKEMEKEKKKQRKNKVNEELKKEAKIKRNLMRKLNTLEDADLSKSIVEEEIKKGQIKDEDEIYVRIRELKKSRVSTINKSSKRYGVNKTKKSSSNIEKPKKVYSEDYKYWKDLYG